MIPRAKQSAPISREAAYVHLFKKKRAKRSALRGRGRGIEGGREGGGQGGRGREGEFWVIRSFFDFIEGWMGVGGWVVVG